MQINEYETLCPTCKQEGGAHLFACPWLDANHPDGKEYVEKMDTYFRGAEGGEVKDWKLFRFLKQRPVLEHARNHRIRHYTDADLTVHSWRNPGRTFALAVFRGEDVDASYYVVKNLLREREDALKKILEHVHIKVDGKFDI
jgi:hypothetical protein